MRRAPGRLPRERGARPPICLVNEDAQPPALEQDAAEAELEVLAGIAHLVAALLENARTVGALAVSEGRLRALARRLRYWIAPTNGLMSQSMAMTEVIEQTDADAQTDAKVLLLGTTGTRKELLAPGCNRSATARSLGV